MTFQQEAKKTQKLVDQDKIKVIINKENGFNEAVMKKVQYFKDKIEGLIKHDGGSIDEDLSKSVSPQLMQSYIERITLAVRTLKKEQVECRNPFMENDNLYTGVIKEILDYFTTVVKNTEEQALINRLN